MVSSLFSLQSRPAKVTMNLRISERGPNHGRKENLFHFQVWVSAFEIEFRVFNGVSYLANVSSRLAFCVVSALSLGNAP